MFPRFRAPETMTAAEQAALLRATAAHADPRDHVLYSMALGTGLRLKELLGLDVGHVSPDGQAVRRRCQQYLYFHPPLALAVDWTVLIFTF